ncbi:MAG: DUF5656 family protein [Anaerolineae bacterium]
MSRREQNWFTIGLVVLSLLLASLITLPTRLLTLNVLGSELTLKIDTAVQFGLLATLLVCLGSELAIRTHPYLPDTSFGYSVTFWILPGVITFSSFLLLPTFVDWPYRFGFIFVVALLLYLVLSMQYHSMDPSGGSSWSARLVLQVAVYLAALIFFVQISSSAMRAIVSATSVLLVSAMLSLELVRELESRSGRIWFYAFSIGLLMSEFKWILNYVKIDARIGGAALLLLFYLLTGLTRSNLQKRLSGRVILEYSFIVIIAVSLLLFMNRWF